MVRVTAIQRDSPIGAPTPVSITRLRSVRYTFRRGSIFGSVPKIQRPRWCHTFKSDDRSVDSSRLRHCRGRGFSIVTIVEEMPATVPLGQGVVIASRHRRCHSLWQHHSPVSGDQARERSLGGGATGSGGRESKSLSRISNQVTSPVVDVGATTGIGGVMPTFTQIQES